MVHRLDGERHSADAGAFRHWLAGDGRRDPSDDLEQPCPAGVDDSGLLEHGEQIGRAGESVLAARDDEREQLEPVEPLGLGDSAASAISRITVSIVPSTGRRTAR